jgi:glycosyltransferase involved in cell wall biosynthesis
MLAHYFGVPKRIAHSHNDTSLNDGRSGLWRKLYLLTTEWFIRRQSTIGLACSSHAATNLFGKSWKNNPRRRVLYCGIDLEPFKSSVDRDEVRRELGIPSDAFVLGHVGRFAEQKNHDFLLDIFVEVVRREPCAYLLLVGDGPLREAVVQKTQRLGLIDKVIFSGMRPDVPRLMLGAMDVFLFPSHHEGLPLVLIEAQAAGLPTVISDAVPAEAVIAPELIKTLSLKDDKVIWARAVADSINSRQHGGESQQLVSNSRFNVIHSIVELCSLYLSGKNS